MKSGTWRMDQTWFCRSPNLCKKESMDCKFLGNVKAKGVYMLHTRSLNNNLYTWLTIQKDNNSKTRKWIRNKKQRKMERWTGRDWPTKRIIISRRENELGTRNKERWTGQDLRQEIHRGPRLKNIVAVTHLLSLFFLFLSFFTIKFSILHVYLLYCGFSSHTCRLGY
jgi:hypothetical protein